MSGRLYVVSSPIGNLSDLSFRALEVLRSCPVIAAEDTRHSRGLLSHYAIAGKKLRSLHAHSTAGEVQRLVEALQAGEDVALLTDAGTPSVSDPGDVLVRAARAHELPVVPVPGASAVLAALVGSGLTSGGGFRFVGFLPRDGSARTKALQKVWDTPETTIAFEAPGRTAALLHDLSRQQPSRRACVARELTKLHEEFVFGTLAELAARDVETEPWRGEIVLVLAAHEASHESLAPDQAAIAARIDEELALGVHPKTIADKLAIWAQQPKRELYNQIVARKHART